VFTTFDYSIQRRFLKGKVTTQASDPCEGSAKACW
jgi:hypothetical protein